MSDTTIKIIAVGMIGVIVGFGSAALIQKNTRGMNDDFGRHMDEMDKRGNHMMHGESGMKEEMDGMMMGLDGKTGDEFDKAFLKEMIMHHEGAVQMAESALKNSKHQEIKDLSNAIISAQNKEIEQMKIWETEWYSQQ